VKKVWPVGDSNPGPSEWLAVTLTIALTGCVFDEEVRRRVEILGMCSVVVDVVVEGTGGEGRRFQGTEEGKSAAAILFFFYVFWFGFVVIFLSIPEFVSPLV